MQRLVEVWKDRNVLLEVFDCWLPFEPSPLGELLALLVVLSWVAHAAVEAQVGLIVDSSHVGLEDQPVGVVWIPLEFECAGREAGNLIEECKWRRLRLLLSGAVELAEDRARLCLVGRRQRRLSQPMDRHQTVVAVEAIGHGAELG